MALLIITKPGEEKSTTHECGPAPVSIGESDENRIVVRHPNVSPRQAEIVHEENDYFLVDLGGGQSTILNGLSLRPNEKMILRAGDVVKIGDIHIQFQIFDELVNQSFNEITDSDIIEVKLLKKVLQTLDQDRLISLEVVSGVAAGKRVFLNDDQAEIVIGRDPLSDLSIEEYVVSRRHAKVFRRGKETIIHDMESKNGTFLNGVRIKKEVLHDGDRIGLGTIILQFRNPGELDLGEISREIKESRKREEVIPEAEPRLELGSETDSEMESELRSYSEKFSGSSYPTPRPAKPPLSLSPWEMGLIGFGTLVIGFALIGLINLFAGK